jgi:CRP-like cAMP-binding protein
MTLAPTAATGARPGASRPIRILDYLPDLADGLDPAAREQATQLLVAPAVILECGSYDLRELSPDTGTLLLIAEGLIKRVVRICNQKRGAVLLGPGDPIRAGDGRTDVLLPRRVTWKVIQDARIALLDAAFFARLARAPALIAPVVHSAINRCQAMSTQNAICAHVQIERRVMMLFWHLAERWGKVGPDYLRVDIPLSHAAIAELVNSQRPSVSTAIGRLRRRGLLDRDARGWIVHAAPEDAAAQLKALASRSRPRQMARA